MDHPLRRQLPGDNQLILALDFTVKVGNLPVPGVVDGYSVKAPKFLSDGFLFRRLKITMLASSICPVYCHF